MNSFPKQTNKKNNIQDIVPNEVNGNKESQKLNKKKNNSESLTENIPNLKTNSMANINQYDITSTTEEIINLVSVELESIDSEVMLENFVKILNTIQEDISRKFENSKYLDKIKTIFEKNFEIIINYFIRCLQHVDTLKKSVSENLSIGLQQLTNIIKSELENIQTKFQNSNSNNQNLQNNNNNSNFVFDDEFVTLINSLSQTIKDFMKNTKNCIKSLSQSADSSVDLLMNGKSNLSDVLMQLNSTFPNSTGSKYSQSQITSQKAIAADTKLLKEKISNVMDKIEQLNTIRMNLSKDIKYIDGYSGKFYEDAKLIFKGLKVLHNDKLNEIQKFNSENIQNEQNNQLNSNPNLNDYNLSNQNYHTNNIQNSRSTDFLRVKKKGSSVSPTRKRQTAKVVNNLNNSGSFINSSVDNSYFNIKNSRNASILSKTKTQFTQSKSSNSQLNKSTDYFNQGSRISAGLNSNALNTSVGNTQILNTQQGNNEEKLVLCSKLEELKTRNQELLEEIEKLHETYVNTQYENICLRQENEALKGNNIEETEQESKITPVPTSVYSNNTSSIKISSNNLTNKSKNIGKFTNQKPYYQTTVNNLLKNEKNSKNINKFGNLFKLSEMVILFIRQMSSLQDAVSNKSNNIKEMKKEFESKKKELMNFANEIKIRKDVIKNAKQPINNEEISNNDNDENEEAIEEIQEGSKVVNDNKFFNISKKDNTNLNSKNRIESNQTITPNNEEITLLLEKLTAEFNDERERLNEEIKSLNEIIASQDEEIKKIGNNAILTKRFEDENKKLIKEINQMKVTNETLNKEIKKLKLENDYMTKNLKDFTKSIEEMKQAAEDQILKTKAQVRDLEVYAKNLTEELEVKNNLLSSYTASKDDLENKNKHNNKLTEELNKKNSKINEIIGKIKSLNEEVDKKNSQITILNDKLYSLNEEINKKTIQITDLKNNTEILIKDSDKKNIQIESLINKNNEYKQLLETNNSKLLYRENKIDEDKLNLAKMEEDIRDLKSKINLLSNEKKTLNDELNLKTQSITLLKENIQSLEKFNSELKLKVQNSSSSSNDLITEIQHLTNKVNEYKLKVIPEMNDKSNLELEKTKEAFTKLINEKDETSKSFKIKEEELIKQLDELNYNLKDKENQLVNATKKFKDNLEKKEEELRQLQNKNKEELVELKKKNEEEIKSIENTYKKNVEIIIQETSNKEKEFSSKLKKVTDDLGIKENELQDLKSKLNKVQVNKTENLENLSRKLSEGDTQLKKMKSDYDIMNREFSTLSKIFKSTYDTINDKYKSTNKTKTKEIKTKGNHAIKHRSIDEAFLFDEDDEFEIKDDNQTVEEISFGMDLQTPDYKDMANEIIQSFNTLLLQPNKMKEENKLDPKEFNTIIQKEKQLNEYLEENKKLKILFEECTQTIFDAIKTTAPHMFEELNINDNDNSNYLLKAPNTIDSKNSKLTPSVNSARSESDFIQKAVEMFKKYNNEINSENAKLKKRLEEAENNARRFRIMADEYKSALELAMSRADIYDNEKKNVNLNNSSIITKDNVNNFTVDDLMEMNLTTEEKINNNEISKSNNQPIEGKVGTPGAIKIENNIDNNTVHTNTITIVSNLPRGLIRTDSGNTHLTQDQEKEIKDLMAIQDDIVQKLVIKEQELENYKETCNRLLRISNTEGSPSKSIPTEKYEILLENYNLQLEKFDEIERKYDLIKRDYELMKSRVDLENNNFEKEDNPNQILIPKLNLKAINKSFNNKGDLSIDDEVEYLEKLNHNNFEINKNETTKNPNSITTAPSKILNNTVANIKKGPSTNYFAMLNNSGMNDSHLKTQNSGRSKKTDNTIIQEAINNAMSKFEEHEQLLVEQLATIKEELKETRQQRDVFKRKYEESITLQDGKKNEILNLLRQAIEKLIIEITLTPKIKELLTVILRVLDYTEEQITIVINNKDKKKNNFLGFFR